ncbi:hypothetical protein [Actinoplanes sp. DH11]|uniref:DUF6907 domain-containing protein n=1 Tax=Actinoplanes sp. DH11 TaxID=2857011 RepID=UPI001E5B8849|nr:hypothetical protein [Actinoplanes sp. DH11]
MPDDREQAAELLFSWKRRDELTAETSAEILRRIFPEEQAAESPADRSVDATAERWQREHRERLARIERADCPEWCTIDHAEDDERDDLVLHQADDHTDGTIRRLLAADTLDIRIARTDSLTEGGTGEATVMVHVDVELRTWEQAAELARAILDGFGYLEARS